MHRRLRVTTTFGYYETPRLALPGSHQQADLLSHRVLGSNLESRIQVTSIHRCNLKQVQLGRIFCQFLHVIAPITWSSSSLLFSKCWHFARSLLFDCFFPFSSGRLPRGRAIWKSAVFRIQIRILQGQADAGTVSVTITPDPYLSAPSRAVRFRIDANPTMQHTNHPHPVQYPPQHAFHRVRPQ